MKRSEEIFAPGIISTGDQFELGCSFNHDVKLLFASESDIYWMEAKIIEELRPKK